MISGKDIALWVGILIPVGGACIGLNAKLDENRREAVQQAVDNAKRDSNLSEHLTEIDRHLEFIDGTLPAEKQEIAHEVFRQVARAEKAEQSKLDMSEPVMAQHGMPHYAVGVMSDRFSTGVSADSPAEGKPQ